MYGTHYHLPLISHPWQHSGVRLAVWMSPRFCDTVSSLVFFIITVYVYCIPILVHVFCVFVFFSFVGPIHELSTAMFL